MALVASCLHGPCEAGASFLGGFHGLEGWEADGGGSAGLAGGPGRAPPDLAAAAAVETSENAAASGQGCRNDVHAWCSNSHHPEAGVTNIFRILQFSCLGG